MASVRERVWDSSVGRDAGLSAGLQELIARYNSTPAYTKKTDQEIKDQAEGQYKSYYDQLRLASQQQQQRSDLALQQQRENLQRTYDKQREASAKEYANAYSQADRQMLSRGMQRSSYTAQTLANIANKGVEAQNALWEQQGAAEGQIDAQRTQLAQQLADQLMQYDASQASDVLNRIREIEDQEYERGVTDQNTRNALSTQIYEFMQQDEQQRIAQDQWQAQMDYQRERDKIADDQWLMQFNENVRQFNEQHKGGSGSGSGSKKKSTVSGAELLGQLSGAVGGAVSKLNGLLNGSAASTMSSISRFFTGQNASQNTSPAGSNAVLTPDEFYRLMDQYQ